MGGGGGGGGGGGDVFEVPYNTAKLIWDAVIYPLQSLS